MEQLLNFWYNLYINQKAFLDFEYEINIKHNYFDYNDCAIMGYIIFMLKTDIKGFNYQYFEGKKYVLLTNNLILTQLPKLKKTMLNKRLEKMINKNFVYRIIENENYRYLSINTELLNKCPDKMIYPTDFLKRLHPDIYDNLINHFKPKHTEKVLNKIIESYNLDRIVQQNKYNPSDILNGLINFINKWDDKKYK
jgi:hypothetical protein